jgi:ATP-dependent DNA ligase
MVPAAFKGHNMESMDYSTFGGQDLTGWMVSEKLDGVRGLWDGRALWTRQGNRIAAPAWFTAGLPAWPLDGELYAGPGTLARVAGLVRRESAKGADWGGVRFCLFDAPAAAGGFADRLAQLNEAAILLPGTSARLRILNARAPIGWGGILRRSGRAVARDLWPGGRRARTKQPGAAMT